MTGAATLAFPREGYDFPPHWLDVGGGTRLHYVDEGRGPAVVMLHGNPSWSFHFRTLARALSDRHRVVVVDHVGCGRSDKPDRRRYPYTFARRVADLTTLLDRLDLGEDVTLVLHDWGGPIGLAWAVEHAARVRRLVVFNSTPCHFPSVRPLPRVLKLIRTPLGTALVLRLNLFAQAAAWTGCRWRPLDARLRRAYVAPYRRAPDRIATLRFVEDIPLGPGDAGWEEGLRMERGLPRLSDRPLLLCWGERDVVFTGAFRDRWVREFPRAEVHRFPRAGHYVLEDAGPEILPLVQGFLERTR